MAGQRIRKRGSQDLRWDLVQSIAQKCREEGEEDERK
jgi:hypothetical protein